MDAQTHLKITERLAIPLTEIEIQAVRARTRDAVVHGREQGLFLHVVLLRLQQRRSVLPRRTPPTPHASGKIPRLPRFRSAIRRTGRTAT